ncbi:hypothetical protein BHM03_00034689 [Ensete ventricosum]|nr:hypothetical protein BHM03_00034689 [Ensete ventricosum]
MAESYGEPVGAMVWGENMMSHATLMARGEGVWWRSVRTPPPRMLTWSSGRGKRSRVGLKRSVVGSCKKVRRKGLYSNNRGIRTSIPYLLHCLSYRCISPRHPWSLLRGAHLQLGDVDLAHLTCVRSVIRPLTPPCLCQAGFPVSGRPRWRASCPRPRGRGSQVNICHIISLPPEKTFSKFPIKVLKMRFCAEPSVCGEVRLVPKAG